MTIRKLNRLISLVTSSLGGSKLSKFLLRRAPVVSHHNSAQNAAQREADFKYLTRFGLKFENDFWACICGRVAYHAAAQDD